MNYPKTILNLIECFKKFPGIGEKTALGFIQKFKTIENLYENINDEIVKPSDWNIWIPDLIRYWRMKRYTHISGKLFMRTDLFKSLEGVNNINDLINNAINIEWQKEELFSFFFQS